MSVDTQRQRAHCLLDRLPAAAISNVLAVLARVCPQCGNVARIETSRPARDGRGRLAYLRCTGCGRRWKVRMF